MNIILFQVFTSICLVFILSVVIFSLSKKNFLPLASSSPFECGFTPHSSSRQPFSLQFFLLALIFLIFDIEIIILFPCLLKKSQILSSMLTPGLIFMVLLVLGLGVEWSQKSLEWLK